MALLHMVGLRRDHGEIRGVGPISLKLNPGVHGLLGPNGAGKSTLIRTLLGFYTPTAGRATILGHDVTKERHLVRDLVGYMPEHDVAVPGLTTAQTVRLSAELHGMPSGPAHEATAEALHAVGLGAMRNSRQGKLSTGQRQRVKLAAALVHAPELLILDEPTSGLDPEGRARMLELISEIVEERQASVLISTHILSDIEAVCEDAVVLREGKLVGTETVRAARARKLGARKQWYEVRVLEREDKLAALLASRRVPMRRRGGHLEVVAGSAAHLLRVAKEARVLLTQCTPVERGIEERILEKLS